jgi:class 3 adenylate cyclase
LAPPGRQTPGGRPLSRLAPLDRALVLILVPLWVVCFALAMKVQLDGGGAALIGVSSSSDRYPILTGESSALFGFDPLEDAGLRGGDVLIRVGETDLHGFNALQFHHAAWEASVPGSNMTVTYARGGHQSETVLELVPVAGLLPWQATSFAYVASALFLLLRARPTPTVRGYFYASLALAFALGGFPLNSWLTYAAYFVIWITAQSVCIPLLVRFNLLYPDDKMPAGRWLRIWPWILSINGPAVAIGNLEGHWDAASAISAGTTGLGAAAILIAITYKYRHGDPVARRQIRWFVVGAYVAVLPIVVLNVIAVLVPRYAILGIVGFWAAPLFPIFFLLSISRFNLFDVDRLISATASYNILAVVLGAGALVVMPRIAEAASGLVGIDPGTGRVVLSLALAALVVPAHRRLRPQIDRLFFRERYELDQGIADLLPALSECADARELTERAGSRLHSLLRPEVCVVYATGEGGYAPVFVEGRAVPPAFETDSLLIGALRGRHAPLSLSAAGRRPDQAPLGPFDRAALETLQAEVVVPVRQGAGLAAFVCLGPKRSGDVYTSTDLSLLTAVAETVSRELRHFDQEETIREGREMQESLRRYVPGAVAEQLSAGGDLSSGEREVSVLFVDIRGYTSFSESRRAEEIFSTVNRYTETVSQIVERHAGSVVEFNGDGMMAVFGAPRELAHKERAAVEAGREIVAAVGALRVEDASGGQTRLSVGVGIATGEAFVGNIQAVDRMIWSAIGNTTNLAARLQSLTRELDASLVIDAGTWERSQPAAEGFEKHSEVPIRGRRESLDLYALPLRADS